MAGAIGDTLPLGLGIALNPLAIVAGILVLSSPEARAGGVAFALGWVLGLALLVAVALLIVDARVAADPTGAADGVAYGKLLVGLVMVLAAGRTLLRRGAADDPETLPAPLRAVANASPIRAFGVGLFLSTVSLKNLALLAAAAATIAQAQLGREGSTVAAAVFLAVGSLGILAPLLVHLFGGEAGTRTLERWRDWLARNVEPIAAVVILFMGVNLIGKGIGGAF